MFWTTFLRFTLWVLYAVADNFRESLAWREIATVTRWRGPAEIGGNVLWENKSSSDATERAGAFGTSRCTHRISCNCLVPKDSTNRRR
jgi:hypothetical protein